MSSAAMSSAELFARALGPETDRFVFWRVRLNLTPEAPLELPEFAGSLVRGALGAALRQVSCTTGAPTCAGCPEIPVCPYGYAFETPLPIAGDASAKSPGPFVPHPFALALDAPPQLAAGEPLGLELTLIGRGRSYLASFVEAVRLLARRGLARSRTRLTLTGVDDLAPAGPRPILSPGGLAFTAEPTEWRLRDLARPVPGSLELTTLSPIRLLERGQPPDALELPHLLRALFRRIGALARFHAGFEPAVDYRALLDEAARTTVLVRRLVWSERARYSARQQRRMVLGGLEGSLVLTGDLAHALPFLALGERLQVGKGTSFGLGRYRLTEHR